MRLATMYMKFCESSHSLDDVSNDWMKNDLMILINFKISNIKLIKC